MGTFPVEPGRGGNGVRARGGYKGCMLRPPDLSGELSGRLGWPWVWSAALLLNSVYLQTQIRSLGACQHDRVGLAFFLFLCVCEDAKCLTHTGVTQPAAGVGGTYTGGGAFRQGGGAPGWAGLQGSCSALSQVVDQRRPAPFSAGKPWPGSLQDHLLAGQGSGGSSPHTPLVGSDTVSRFCDTELILAFDIGHRSQGWVSKLSFYFAEGH